MATVRTQLVSGQRRIITKDGRVSCSCCESEPFCCMYPADELGNLYGADDLPDAVTVNWTNRFTGSMSKSGSGYAGGGATLQVVNGIWRLSDSDGTRNVGRCLIRGDGNLTQGDDLVEDQFADTYRVSFESTPIPEVASVVIPRVLLCRWLGGDGNGVAEIYYAGGGTESIGRGSLKWYAGLFTSTNSVFATKQSGNENTPIGTYQGQQGTLTVSEA
jgi:hypothetical protein